MGSPASTGTPSGASRSVRSPSRPSVIAVAAAVGMEPAEIDAMFRLLAIAKYDERYVIPQAHGEIGVNPHSQQGACGLDFAGGPGSCGALSQEKDPFGAAPPIPGAETAGGNVSFLDFRKRS